MVHLIMFVADICQGIGIFSDSFDHLGDAIDLVMLGYYFYLRSRVKPAIELDEYVMD